MQQSSTPSSTSAQHAKQELLSAGWPCCEFINSGVSVQVLQRPSDSLHSIFTGDLELEADAGVDSSGLDVWSGACNLLCSHIACHPELIRARNVLELGSGMGVCGLFAAQTRFGARTVALTDAGNFVMKVLAANLVMNEPKCISECRVFEYSWGSGKAASCDHTCTAPYDVIIASDLVYSVVGGRLLAHSIADNLKPGGVFLMAHTKRLAIFFGPEGELQRESSDSGLDEFCKALRLPSAPRPSTVRCRVEMASAVNDGEEIVLLQWTG